MMLNCDQIFLTISSNVLCFLHHMFSSNFIYIYSGYFSSNTTWKKVKEMATFGEGCSGMLLVIIWRYKSPTGNKLEELTMIAVTCYSRIVYYSLFLWIQVCYTQMYTATDCVNSKGKQKTGDTKLWSYHFDDM